MKHLIVKVESRVDGWMGPCKPTFWTYPLYAAPRMDADLIDTQIKGYRKTLHPRAFVVDFRVVDDGLSESEFEARERAAERAERLRCLPPEYDY